MILIIEEGVIISVLFFGFVTISMRLYKNFKAQQELVPEPNLKTIDQAGTTVITIPKSPKKLMESTIVRDM